MNTPTTVRVWESEFAVYRKIWQSHVLLAFVQPLLAFHRGRDVGGLRQLSGNGHTTFPVRGRSGAGA